MNRTNIIACLRISSNFTILSLILTFKQENPEANFKDG